MSAVVFCLGCEKVMNVSEYLHPFHKCCVDPVPLHKRATTKQPKGVNNES